jgi:hypothetical protein
MTSRDVRVLNTGHVRDEHSERRETCVDPAAAARARPRVMEDYALTLAVGLTSVYQLLTSRSEGAVADDLIEAADR